MAQNDNACLRYEHAIEIIAKRWTPLILRVLLPGPLRFSELADRLSAVSDRMLSERLKDLEREGIVERRVMPESPVRVEYSLTKKGQALGPVVQAIECWSGEWIELDAEHAAESASKESAA